MEQHWRKHTLSFTDGDTGVTDLKYRSASHIDEAAFDLDAQARDRQDPGRRRLRHRAPGNQELLDNQKRLLLGR